MSGIIEHCYEIGLRYVKQTQDVAPWIMIQGYS